MALTTSYARVEGTEAIWEMTIGDLLRQVAAEVPDQPALVAGSPDPGERRRWTYAELLAEAEAIAAALLARFEPGERVAVWAPNIPEWVLLEYGAALAGLVLVTVNPAYKASELAYILRQSRAAGLFLVREFRGNPMREALLTVRDQLPELREALFFEDFDEFRSSGDKSVQLPAIKPTDPAAVIYTSGTTGFPKGAVLHHLGMINNGRFTAEVAGVPTNSRWVSPMPLFHVGGCMLAVLGCLARRATTIQMVSFDAGLALDLCATEQAQTFHGVPTMFIAMMEHPDFATRDLSAFQLVMAGGALVPADLVRRIEKTLGVKFVIIFGQTECGGVATMASPDDSPDDKAETIGRALTDFEIKVVDTATGETVAPGTIGELCLRGFSVMHGYFEMPDATSDAIDGEGWLRSGDLATMDDRGYCRIEGRLKEMIIRGGENIYPAEIESLLFAHPDVADVAIVGVPDDRWGEQVAAVIRPAEACVPDPDALFAYVREHLANYKTPRYWIFVDEFPLTGSGKVQKFVLRAQFVNGEIKPVSTGAGG
jgi:fatty-acyl-CoA synthase